MIHIMAPNGLLVRAEPYPEGPCGVGWTSDPALARTFDDSDAALAWAQQEATGLVPAIVTSLGRSYQWGDLRFPMVNP